MPKIKLDKKKMKEKLETKPKKIRTSYEGDEKLFKLVKDKLKADNKKNGTKLKMVDVITAGLETYVES